MSPLLSLNLTLKYLNKLSDFTLIYGLGNYQHLYERKDAFLYLGPTHNVAGIKLVRISVFNRGDHYDSECTIEFSRWK